MCEYCNDRKDLLESDIDCGTLGKITASVDLTFHKEPALRLNWVYEVDNTIMSDSGKGTLIPIGYCPFCGKKL